MFKLFKLQNHILSKLTNLHLTVLKQSCSVIGAGMHCLQKNAGFSKLSKYLQMSAYVLVYLCTGYGRCFQTPHIRKERGKVTGLHSHQD